MGPPPEIQGQPYLRQADVLPQRYVDITEDRPGAPRGGNGGGGGDGPSRLAWMVGGLAALVGVGLAVYYLLPGEEVTTGGTAAGTVTTGSQLPVTAGDSTGDAALDSGGVSSTIELEDGTVLLPSSETDLTGTMVDDQILVLGEVPTTQELAALTLLLEEVAGIGNVNTDNVTLNPDVGSPDRLALIVGSEVVFAAGSDQIEDRFLPVLDNLVTLFGKKPELTAVIEGHADSDGVPAENLALSQRRADAVAGYLTAKGVDGIRLVPIGRGSVEPVADNATIEGRAQNRRIEFVVAGFRLDL